MAEISDNHPVPPVRAGGDSAKRWIAAILITGTFAAMLIHQSFAMGTLALPALYDDISYFVSGAELLRQFHEKGFAGVARAYFSNPPHAPLSTAMAFIGFAALGIQNWVGPAMNAVLLLFFVRAFLAAAAGLSVAQGSVLAVALLGIPFFGITVMQFRPDMICSLLIASGALYIILVPQWLERSREQLIAGLLFAAALWAKPTVFHLTAVLFGTAMLLASSSLLRAGNLRQPMKACLTTTVVAVGAAVPYYAFAGGRVVTYIWRTAFGEEAAIWVKPQSLKDHVLTYLTGEYGQYSFGSWIYCALVVAAIAILLLRAEQNRARSRGAMLVALMVLLAYMAVTIPKFKGPHGYAFAALLIAAIALAAIGIARALPRMASWGATLLLLLYSAWHFGWPYHFEIWPGYVQARWAMVRQSADALGPDVVGKTFLQTTPGLHLNYSVLALEYYARGWTPPRGDTIQASADLAEHRRRLSGADIVFALTPEITEVFPHLPTSSARFRAQEIELIEQSGLFEAPIRIEDPISKGAALLYLKPKLLFTEFAKADGLYPVTGPFPQWSLPRVRWGGGLQSTVVAQGAPGKPAKLVLDARTVGVVGQTLAVQVNGRPGPTLSITEEFGFHVVPIEFDSTGRAEIVLRYGKPLKEAVLYKTLVVRQ
jgi:hypothetical protein